MKKDVCVISLHTDHRMTSYQMTEYKSLKKNFFAFDYIITDKRKKKIQYLDKMMLADTRWNVPYIFKGVTIIHDNHSWIGGERLADLLNEKLLSFRLGKRQKSLFGS